MKCLHKATLGGQSVYKWPKTDDIVTLEGVLEFSTLDIKDIWSLILKIEKQILRNSQFYVLFN